MLQGAFCILFLLTGHWIMFLLTLPPACYNLNLYLSRKHLIDVTEVFRVLNTEKKVRIAKLGFYVIFFAIVIARLAFSAINAVFGDEDDLHLGKNLRIRKRPFPLYQPSSSLLPPDSNISRFHGDLNHGLQEMSMQGLNMKFKEYDALLNECIAQRVLRGGQRVQAHMMKTRYLPPVYLRTRLIVMYVKCEVLSDARKIFDEMPLRNVVSWTAMISGYSRSGFYSEALILFIQMLKSGTDPNEFTFSTVLSSCTGLFEFECGMQIHSLVIKSPLESHVHVGCSLLDLYAKAGRIHEAQTLFDNLPERDSISCTALISGYAQLGLDKEALELFCALRKEGFNSNYVTYTSILTALSGLAASEYGRQVHSYVLRSELYFYVVLQNSLIDMYSKCGNLTYARRIFDNMSGRTVISWNTMLAGYSKHGIGKAVVDLYCIMNEENEIKPDSATLLTVLSGCSHGGMENRGLKIFYDMASKKDGVELGIEHYGCVVDLLGRAGLVNKALLFIYKMPYEPNAAIWSSLLGACRVHQNVGVGKIAGERLLEIEPENAGNYVVLCNLYACGGRWDDAKRLRELMKEKTVVKEPGKSWIEFGRTIHTFYASAQSNLIKDDVFYKVNDLSDRIKSAGYIPDLSSVLYDVDEEERERILLGHSEKLALAFGMINISESKPIRVMKNLRICVDCHNFAKFVSQVYGRELVIRDKSRFHHITQGKCSCGDYW
ncbi:pentatricopeptide repeat-containing protein mitochondrial-like [Dorcoceras hygrometricum]|uniref:Pentatricopeptide repeat-containing protein mitochondrial-like n=1 Tax=Dorcoceras hygrometricum TaxID=472368 RepID=A0A2Z7CGY7_9LAMI|nr:pentatricopeptide repeat-containing protein mitochondrial-like [Dorcoceras hygrometricum]